ncbi:hypothetical protein L7F22_032344 [Adiantum nelumboides]|nr:hypothetical protein [Adiantum nelumboides]
MIKRTISIYLQLGVVQPCSSPHQECWSYLYKGRYEEVFGAIAHITVGLKLRLDTDEENKIEDEGDMSQATQQVLPTIDEETPFHKGDAMSTQEVLEHESDFVAQKPSNDMNKESENMLPTIGETQIHEDDMIIKDTYNMPLRDEEVQGSEKKDEANEEHQGALATTEVQEKVDKGTGKATRNANKAQSIQGRVQGTEDGEKNKGFGFRGTLFSVPVDFEDEGIGAAGGLEGALGGSFCSLCFDLLEDFETGPSILLWLEAEDVLTWLDHFDNVAGYHSLTDQRKAMEIRTLLEGIAATWFIQQQDDIKGDWSIIKSLLIQNFAHQNVTQAALQQLNALKQQQSEPVAQFAVKMNQLLLRADPTMSEEMKLFFLWPRLRHDISRRVRDQGPTSFHVAVQIAQRIEGTTHS